VAIDLGKWKKKGKRITVFGNKILLGDLPFVKRSNKKMSKSHIPTLPFIEGIGMPLRGESALANGKFVGKLLVSRSTLTDMEGQVTRAKITHLGSLPRAGTAELVSSVVPCS